MLENALILLDCAYEEFIDDPDKNLAAALIDSAENVVMSRTFSKIFGLAGVRIGWMYGAADIINNVRRVSTTFPLSGT
ncbi:MAG: aminotransferase class I/II-fold pyridoxal phosphate-dependent enzyme [Alphaproteobacteria bacterium]